METQKLLRIARGEEPADLVLRNAHLINVYSGEIESSPCDLAIAGPLIAGIGPAGSYDAREVLDVTGKFLSPGLIDAHVHIESSMCAPAEFARAVLPRGVTAVVVDPHEIANVAGAAGVEWMASASKDLPLTVVVMAPSCVPATHLARGGAELSASEISSLLQRKVVHGLAEVMNFPGVVSGTPEVLDKIQAVSGRPIDGHAPGILGKQLNAYAAAGIGSDHECVTPDEAREKLARGLHLLIREATNARNLDTLLPIITPANARRICFCTDDRTAGDLLREGSIDMMVRRAIAYGVTPIEAIRMATLNTAEWFQLHNLGALAPGKLANINVLSSVERYTIDTVIARGQQVAVGAHGLAIPAGSPTVYKSLGRCSVPWDRISLAVTAKSPTIRVIGSKPDQLITESLTATARLIDGRVEADPDQDILKIAVINRHSGEGQCAIAFIKGFGLRRGAIAGTVAHDHHNLVLIGCDDTSMLTAGKAVTAMSGGLAIADGKFLLESLPLPVGGLMSDKPIEVIASTYDRLLSAARDLGSELSDPFMAMSFMALEVIPSLKLTEQGLVNVETFSFTDVFI